MKPVTIDAELIEKWIDEIAQHDKQARPHHGGCDLARDILAAKKEAYQRVLKEAAIGRPDRKDLEDSTPG